MSGDNFTMWETNPIFYNQEIYESHHWEDLAGDIEGIMLHQQPGHKVLLTGDLRNGTIELRDFNDDKYVGSLDNPREVHIGSLDECVKFVWGNACRKRAWRAYEWEAML